MKHNLNQNSDLDLRTYRIRTSQVVKEHKKNIANTQDRKRTRKPIEFQTS